MAHIQKIKRQDGFVYRSIIKRKGFKTITKVFKSKKLAIDVSCLDLEETYRLKNNLREGLTFGIRNKEFSDWALDYK